MSGYEKELLRLAVVGSVDDGKSTLIGRLLFECGGLFEDQVASVKKATAKRAAEHLGRGLQELVGTADPEALDFSLFTDGLRAEREQGITIDVAYRYFSSGKRKIIVADTPGHLQYTRNMATGASTADAAVILVDARLGVLPQTRRHAYLSALLGIPYLAVAVNKMDLVGFDPEVFARIGSELGDFCRSLGFEQVRLFPVSASGGDNVTRASARTPWHQDGTLLGWLESLPHQRRLDQAPLRFPVQYVLRPHLDYRGFAGQVVSGRVSVGDELLALPSGRRTRVTAIDTFEGQLAQASSPQSVALRLSDEIDVGRGDLLVHPDQAPLSLRRLEARLVWFGERPLNTGHRYLIKHSTQTVSARFEQVLGRLELEDLSEVPADSLALNDIGRVRLSTARPLLCDRYRDNRHTGAFIVIDPASNDTVAAGMILEAVQEVGGQEGSLVTAEQRAQRLGHQAAVVLLPTGTAPSVVQRLEQGLIERGLLAAIARDPETASALAGAGLIALVAPGSPAMLRGFQDVLRGSASLELRPPNDPERWVGELSAALELRS